MDLHVLCARLQAAHLTVAVAESASGGLISAELTRLPGSSAHFRAGVVVYDAASKTQFLGVPEQIFIDYGSVSAESCLALASAVRNLFKASVGIGETSISGPGGGSDSKPVGLSYVAISGPWGDQVRQNQFQGDRDQNRRAAVAGAMDLLASYLPAG